MPPRLPGMLFAPTAASPSGRGRLPRSAVAGDGGKVLDPFAGSGSTEAAAVAERTCAILIERDAAFVTQARRRLRRAAAMNRRPGDLIRDGRQ